MEKEYGLWGRTPEANRVPVVPPWRGNRGPEGRDHWNKAQGPADRSLATPPRGNSGPEEVSLWSLPQRSAEFALTPPHMEGQTRAREGSPCGQAQGPPEAAPPKNGGKVVLPPRGGSTKKGCGGGRESRSRGGQSHGPHPPWPHLYLWKKKRNRER